MNLEPNRPDDQLAEAYRGWAHRQLGDPPPFRAPRPAVTRQPAFPWRWILPVSLAGALAAIVLTLTTTADRPAESLPLFVYEPETLPWPSETDFLLQQPDPTYFPYLIIKP